MTEQPTTVVGRDFLRDFEAWMGVDQTSALSERILAIEAEARQQDASALRTALEQIKREQGKVCEAYELCEHVACASSYSAWATADEALAALPPSAPPALDEPDPRYGYARLAQDRSPTLGEALENGLRSSTKPIRRLAQDRSPEPDR